MQVSLPEPSERQQTTFPSRGTTLSVFILNKIIITYLQLETIIQELQLFFVQIFLDQLCYLLKQEQKTVIIQIQIIDSTTFLEPTKITTNTLFIFSFQRAMQGRQVVIFEGKLTKYIHQQGQGDLPQKGQEIFATYKGTLQDGTLFDSSEDRQNPFTFILGEGRVIKGWDEGFATMKRGEKATLVCSPEHAYGERGSPPKIPPNSTLNFQVELIDFKEKKKEKWQYSDQQKMVEASKSKQNGNEKLKSCDYKGALNDYKEGIEFLEYEHSSEAKQLLNILRLNISQTYLKMNKYGDVIDQCSKVLKEENYCLKALFRRGLAYSKIQDFQKAKNDFNDLLKRDSENSQAKKQLKNIAAAEKAYEKKEKKLFGQIFSRGELYDDVKTNPPKHEVKTVQSESQDEKSDDQIDKIGQSTNQKTVEKMQEEHPKQSQKMQQEPATVKQE